MNKIKYGLTKNNFLVLIIKQYSDIIVFKKNYLTNYLKFNNNINLCNYYF